MNTQYPTDDDTKRAAANRTTEMQKLIDDFHKQIGNALCQNQNRNVRTQHRSHLQLIAAGRASDKYQTLEEALAQLAEEMKESVPRQFGKME